MLNRGTGRDGLQFPVMRTGSAFIPQHHQQILGINLLPGRANTSATSPSASARTAVSIFMAPTSRSLYPIRNRMAQPSVGTKQRAGMTRQLRIKLLNGLQPEHYNFRILSSLNPVHVRMVCVRDSWRRNCSARSKLERSRS